MAWQNIESHYKATKITYIDNVLGDITLVCGEFDRQQNGGTVTIDVFAERTLRRRGSERLDDLHKVVADHPRRCGSSDSVDQILQVESLGISLCFAHSWRILAKEIRHA
jgi:hypothetical protein